MTDRPLQPSRRLRGVAMAARLIWWGLVAAWLALVLTWGALHALIVPRIESLRPWLEQQASRQLGLTLRIGSLTAQADSWRHLPTVEAREVSLLDAEGREALHLDRLQATLSPRSLWRLGFEQLVIDAPSLDVRRRADGRIEVAGVPLPESGGGDSRVADWFFTQREVVLRGGTLNWRDDTPMATDGRTRAPLALTDILLVVRNHGLGHDWRLDADPPAGWGGRVHATGKLRQPLITLHPGRWRDWHGQLFADFSQLDLGQLAPYASDWPSAIRLDAGSGRLRAWIGVADGRPTDTTLDLAMHDVVLRHPISAATQDTPPVPLALADLSGRLSWQDLPRGFALQTQGLQFATTDGLRWPGGNASVRYQAAGNLVPAQGQFSGDLLDLHTLALVAQRLPIDSQARQLLTGYAPSGLVRHLELQWSDKGATGGTVTGSTNASALTPRSAQPPIDAATQPSWIERANWQAKGRIENLGLAAGQLRARGQGSARISMVTGQPITRALPGRPGLSGANVSFDLNQDGGSARLDLHQGELVFPGVFEEAEMPMDDLQAQVVWRRKGSQHEVDVSQLVFANADAAGHASGRWLTGQGADARLPGHLVLQGELTRADGTRVHRYLPLAIPELTRHYVRDAVKAGRAERTVFKVDSNLDHFPPDNAQQGEFYIAADLKAVDFDYVPASLAARNQQPGGWPALSKVDAQLIFNRHDMEVRHARGSFEGLPQLGIVQASARIPELGHEAPVLQVDGQVDGPLAQALDYVKRSPLDAMAGHTFAQSQAGGDASTQLALHIPLTHAAETQVKGRVQVRNAMLQFSPQTPRLEQTQGRVDFTENGFQVSQARTRLLGGDLQFSGSGERETPIASASRSGARAATATKATPTAPTTAPATASATQGLPVTTASAHGSLKLQFEGQGSLTAEGLRQAHELPLLAQLSQALDGQTRYRARLAVTKGLLQAQVDSDLVGLASRLPAPLDKTADAPLPIRFESDLTGPLQDHIRVRLGDLVKAEFVRELKGATPVVKQGVIRIDEQGAPDAALPAEGVDLGVRLDTVDVGAWQQLVAGKAMRSGSTDGTPAPTAASTPSPSTSAGLPAEGDVAAATVATAAGSSSALASFLPNRWSLQVRRLQFQQRSLNNIEASGTRQQSTWSADVKADELAGHMAYRLGEGDAPGSLYARLQHLTLDNAKGDAGASTESQADRALNDLLDRQPDALPGLDIEVQQLKLAGKDLGTLKVLATNRGVRVLEDLSNGSPARHVHEWELRTLSLSVPEATLTASGQWRLDTAVPGAAHQSNRQRETLLDFNLQTHDAGRLLDRLGYAHLFRHGEGVLKGNIHWTGSPLALDYASLGGAVDIDMRNGQFLKADPGPARLLGVLSLQALPRRLALDFRDTFSEGFAFDFIRGEAHMAQGVARTNNLQMKGVSAAVLMEGQADVVRETQDLKVVVVPELNTGTMALIATAINPAVGLGTFLAQLVLKKPLLESVTRTFTIKGTWADPQIARVQSTAADTAAAKQVSESAAPAARPAVPARADSH